MVATAALKVNHPDSPSAPHSSFWMSKTPASSPITVGSPELGVDLQLESYVLVKKGICGKLFVDEVVVDEDFVVSWISDVGLLMESCRLLDVMGRGEEKACTVRIVVVVSVDIVRNTKRHADAIIRLDGIEQENEAMVDKV